MSASGRMRHRIDIHRPVNSTDAAGQPIRNWATVAAAVPAYVQAHRGGEAERAETIQSRHLFHVHTRYRDGITSDMRLTWNGRTLDVESVIDPTGTRRVLVIEAHESV